MTDKINGRTPEEIKRGLEIVNEHCFKVECSSSTCPYYKECAPHTGMMREVPAQLVRDNIALINQLQKEKKRLERERDAAVRTARWQFERRGKDGVTELPVCSGCGATPKYYAPKNDVGMQVPPYCHECGSKMAAVVKMEVE